MGSVFDNREFVISIEERPVGEPVGEVILECLGPETAIGFVEDAVDNGTFLLDRGDEVIVKFKRLP